MPIFGWLSNDDINTDWEDIISLMIPILIVSVGTVMFSDFPDNISQDNVNYA